MNSLITSEFGLTLSRLPKLPFAVHSFTHPGLNLGIIDQPTPFGPVPRHGDKLDKNDLQVSFIIDETMGGYVEIVKWMKLISNSGKFVYDEAKDQGLYSDATLTCFNSKKNPTVNIFYKNIFPISLGDVNFTSKTQDTEYLTCEVTFKIQSFDIETVDRSFVV